MNEPDDRDLADVRRILGAAREPPSLEDRAAVLEAAREELAALRRRSASPRSEQVWRRRLFSAPVGVAVVVAAAGVLMALLRPFSGRGDPMRAMTVHTYAELVRGDTASAYPASSVLFEGLQ